MSRVCERGTSGCTVKHEQAAAPASAPSQIVFPTTAGGNEVVVENGIYKIRPARPFSELRAQMSPESQARATARTKELLAEIPPASAPPHCEKCGEPHGGACPYPASVQPELSSPEVEALLRGLEDIKAGRIVPLEQASAPPETRYEFYQRLRQTPQFAQAEMEASAPRLYASEVKRDPEKAIRRIEKLRELLAWFTLRYQLEHEKPASAPPEGIAADDLRWLAVAKERDKHELLVTFSHNKLQSIIDAVEALSSQLAASQKERDEAKQWLNDAGRAYSPCHEHQPDMWEGDGTCVICEGHALKEQVAAFQRREAALREQIGKVRDYADRCALYGPADAFRESIARLAALASPDPEKEPQ